MTEYIGSIAVPEIVPSGTFPVISDYGYGLAHQPEVSIHQLGSANAKIEQRFLLGNKAKRFTVRKAAMNETDREALRDFWEDCYGPYGAFTYNAPNDDGNGTTAYTCRFENEPLSWEMLSDDISSIGVTLVEIPTSAPTYTLNSTVLRFPSSTLETGLLSQVQEIIPLITIQPKESGYPAIYVSDRRCTVGSQLYLPRLLEPPENISQSIGNEADEAQFKFGNADRVMTALANDTELFRASIEFSQFHVGTGIKVDLWKGEISDWQFDSGPEFQVTAADGIHELTLPYPTRRICRTCWKCFDDGNGCPFTAESTGMDYTNFPDADDGVCDKSYDGANGCLAHGMKHYFGGIVAEPQGVSIRDNSQGRWGYGRPTITSSSIVHDSIYDQLIPEIYTNAERYVDSEGEEQIGRLVDCKIAAGRDESDFYEALGIIGEGPITVATLGHKLDNQYHHGYPLQTGLRSILGADPAGASDYFSLDESGDNTGGDLRKVYSGGKTYKDNYAAGTAALVIRRGDEKGLQLSQISGHAMQAIVVTGLQGWVWTAALTRSWQTLSNPIWIVINMMLRARGLRYASASTAEEYFDVDAAIAAAGICDETAQVLIGGMSGTCTVWTDEGTGEYRFSVTGVTEYPVGRYLTIGGEDYLIETSTSEYGVLQTSPGDGTYSFTISETQFKFQGVIQEEKPLRDWIQEVLMNCLGHYSFVFGKLKLGIRCNSSAVEAFTDGNILFKSLQLSPLKPGFNHLTANFADAEYAFAGNSVSVYDVDHAKLIGGATAPLFLKSQMNLAGVDCKSQAARIAATRLREELGGITSDQWKAARRISFKTTVLALNVEPGMVCSMTHDDMPSGDLNGVPTPNYGEFRVTSWRLNKDYSIDIEGQTTVDAMYDLTDGPKPADVIADPVPTETIYGTHVPDDLKTFAYANGLLLITGCIANKWNDGITEAEFRAKFYTDIPSSADLRTPIEGGTLVHNGTTEIIVTGMAANEFGANYRWTSASAGTWFFAYRHKNKAGWSVWTDGNDNPKWVTAQKVSTGSAADADSGPPQDWTISREAGPGNTVIGVATRPATNSERILFAQWQIRDNRSGSPVLPDSNTSPAGTLYDGSAIAHTISEDGFIITRASGSGFGTAAVGDMVMIDVRGDGSYDGHSCIWNIVAAFEGDDPATATWMQLRNAAVPLFATTDIRIRIVSAIWNWATGGYQGGIGWSGFDYWQIQNPDGTIGDLSSTEFRSPAFPIPAGLTVDDIEFTVYFQNGYSKSNDDKWTAQVPAGNDYEVELADAATIATDARLADTSPRKVFYCLLTAGVGSTRVLGNPADARHRQPLWWIIRQSATGNNDWTLDTKFRTGSVDVNPTLTADYVAHLGAVYDAYDDAFDVIGFEEVQGD